MESRDLASENNQKATRLQQQVHSWQIEARTKRYTFLDDMLKYII